MRIHDAGAAGAVARAEDLDGTSTDLMRYPLRG
jgi:hypothetical protein